MIVSDEDVRRPDKKDSGSPSGWTSLHSWIFLAIVAVGLAVIGVQNRYFYLSPLGLGKAYRIDKFFGGIQEFHPDNGWIKADIPVGPPPQAAAMMPPSAPPGSPGSPTVPMNMPGAMMPGSSVPGMSMHMPPPGAVPAPAHYGDPDTPPISVAARKESVPQPGKGETLPQTVKKESAPPPQMAPPPPPAPELSPEEKYKAFQRRFPDFGQQEFQLANDDLYPDWKKSVGPTASWGEFLELYGDFVQWWQDAGSPSESGFKLWKDFLATRGDN
jgi:hypothetical protein